MEIQKMLTLSTSHIRPETADFLVQEAVHCNCDGMTVYTKEVYGYFVYINECELEYAREKIPEDLLACIDLATNNNCTVLCLDQDADEVSELPAYEWD